ncbi:apolipoprotein D [Galendromus occidentalis]|uniref:Apolipoprotein D n=1 Tax=Galendromus occidentalis TaxID=34638 RepID=A0AAJ6VVQ2_9ACAR|nr:apolipoprotein D [Galendromus occidentalis]
MKFICVLPVALLLVGSVVSHQYNLGSCPPDVPFQSHLDIDKFLGVWYVIQMSSSASACHKLNITRDGEDLRLVTYSRYGLLQKAVDHTFIDTAALRMPDPTEPAKMKIKYSMYMWWEDFTVISTDYDNFAAAFSCVNVIHVGNRQNGMILSRKPYLDLATADSLRKTFEFFGADRSSLSFINQKDCTGLLKSKSEHDRIISLGTLNINRDPKHK